MSSRSGGTRRRENVSHGGGQRRGTSRATLQRSLDAYEGAMRYSTEPQAHVFDYATGEHLFAPAVTEHGLEITGGTHDIARLAGAVLTRNHPDGQGITLDEVRFAAEHHLAELRVVTPDSRYMLYTLPRGGGHNGEATWNAGTFQRQILPAYRDALPRVLEEVRQDVWRGVLPVEHADAAATDAVWRRVAQVVGSDHFIYKSQGWTAQTARASAQAARGRSAAQILARAEPPRATRTAQRRQRAADAFAREMQQLMEAQQNEEA